MMVLGDVASGVSLRMLQERVPRHGGGAVQVVPEDGVAFQAPGHHVVQDAKGIEAGAAGHGEG